MAKALDQMRDRWDRLAPRERRLVMALGATFVVFVIGMIGLIIQNGLTGIATRNDQTREALKAVRGYRIAQMKHAASNAPDVKIPDHAIDLESYLEGIANGIGLTIPSYGARPPVDRGAYTQRSTHIALENVGISDLVRFLEQIETRSRLVAVTSLRIKQSYRDKTKLDVELVVSTYERKHGGNGKGKGNNGKGGGQHKSGESG